MLNWSHLQLDHPSNSCQGVQIIKLLIMECSLSCYFLPLRSRYSQHPQFMFFPQCEGPYFNFNFISVSIDPLWL
jgi:hypothetical protein